MTVGSRKGLHWKSVQSKKKTTQHTDPSKGKREEDLPPKGHKLVISVSRKLARTQIYPKKEEGFDCIPEPSRNHGQGKTIRGGATPRKRRTRRADTRIMFAYSPEREGKPITRIQRCTLQPTPPPLLEGQRVLDSFPQTRNEEKKSNREERRTSQTSSWAFTIEAI